MVTVTEAAAKKIGELIPEFDDIDPEKGGLRIYVKGGGCSGYQYGMAMDDNVTDDDIVIENGETPTKLIIDNQSASLLQGSVVDYVDTLQGAGFAIKNPQAKSTCGCGSSFSA